MGGLFKSSPKTSPKSKFGHLQGSLWIAGSGREAMPIQCAESRFILRDALFTKAMEQCCLLTGECQNAAMNSLAISAELDIAGMLKKGPSSSDFQAAVNFYCVATQNCRFVFLVEAYNLFNPKFGSTVAECISKLINHSCIEMSLTFLEPSHRQILREPSWSLFMDMVHGNVMQLTMASLVNLVDTSFPGATSFGSRQEANSFRNRLLCLADSYRLTIGEMFDTKGTFLDPPVFDRYLEHVQRNPMRNG